MRRQGGPRHRRRRGHGLPGGALATGPGAAYPTCPVAGFDPRAQAWSLSFDSRPDSESRKAGVLEYEVAAGLQDGAGSLIQIVLDTNADGSGTPASLLVVPGDSAALPFAFDDAWHTWQITNLPAP